MSYQVIDGHNNAGTLADFAPQPASPDYIQYPRELNGGDGAVSPDGKPYIILVWSAVSRTDYNTLRTAGGVSDTVFSNQVTARLLKGDNTFGNYNGTLVHIPGKMSKRDGGLVKDVQFLIKDLVAL